MKENIFNRIIASVMLTAFCFSHGSILTALAADDIGLIQDYVQQNAVSSQAPIIRGMGPTSLKLKGDVALTNKRIPINLSLRDSDVKQVLRMGVDTVTKNNRITNNTSR